MQNWNEINFEFESKDIEKIFCKFNFKNITHIKADIITYVWSYAKCNSAANNL